MFHGLSMYYLHQKYAQCLVQHPVETFVEYFRHSSQFVSKCLIIKTVNANFDGILMKILQCYIYLINF